jgi:hypothetical protein
MNSHTNNVLARVRQSLGDPFISVSEDYDVIDHLDAWVNSLKEESALKYYTEEEIEHGLKVITRLISVRETITVYELAEKIYAIAHELPNDPEDGEWSDFDKEVIAIIARNITNWIA